MIFLTNEQIAQVLDMKTCIDAMEDAYRELNELKAGYRPRIDFYVPNEPHYYRWGTMEGASRKLGVFAIRMKSDMLAWENQDGFMVEDKYCMERGTYCGLIFLTSTRNGEPLAIMNDGYLQHMRVGACAGLGTKYLARKNAKVMAMIGSGGMARTYAEAIKHVRPLEVMRVFSPTKTNREAFAAEMTEKLDIEVIAVDSPEKALKGADIVSLTTDSLIPVIKAEWLEPGTHINNVALGRYGRNRTNIWDYVSQNTLNRTAKSKLALHPTCKPVAMIADAMRDCSNRGGLILDPFGGAGTTLIAAERAGRRARVIELNPIFVDVSIERWQRLTGSTARHADSGQLFLRSGSVPAANIGG